jgi:hypothetical protein
MCNTFTYNHLATKYIYRESTPWYGEVVNIPFTIGQIPTSHCHAAEHVQGKPPIWSFQPVMPHFLICKGALAYP